MSEQELELAIKELRDRDSKIAMQMSIILDQLERVEMLLHMQNEQRDTVDAATTWSHLAGTGKVS